MQLQIREERNGSKLTVSLMGVLNTMTSTQLEQVVSTKLDGVTELVFDFAKLEYLTSAGIRVLMDAQVRMNKAGSMAITHMNAEIRDVFDVTGLLDIMTVLP